MSKTLRAFGERASILKEQLLDPLFSGFDKRAAIEAKIKELGRTQQQQQVQQQQPWGGFPQQQQPQAMAANATNQAEQLVNSTFSFDKIFTVDPRYGSSVKMASDSAHADLDKIGRGDLKNKALPAHELDPVLSTAANVARSLRENPIRCLQLAIQARSAVGTSDEEVLQAEAIRIYFDQQRRALSLVCRILREAAVPPVVVGFEEQAEQEDEEPDAFAPFYKAALDMLVDTPPVAGVKLDLARRLCSAMRQSFFDYASAYSSMDTQGVTQAHVRERRKGREGEMRLACEALQLMLSRPKVAPDEVTRVVHLYMELSGYFDAHPADDTVTFYGCMLACAAASALIRQNNPVQNSRGIHDQLVVLLECGSDTIINVDATPLPARGYMQFVLSVSQLLAADDRWLVSMRYAVHNRALHHIDAKITPCILLERWSEYSVVMARTVEEVLRLASTEMRDRLEEFAIMSESSFPERRHDTLMCLLRSLARAYTRLPHESRHVFEGHQLELIKRWIVKCMTQEQQSDIVFALKAAFLELLSALYTALSVRLAPQGSSSSEVLGDARELMRVVDGLLEQLQISPVFLTNMLREYSDAISPFLGIPHGDGYVWTPQRQQMLSSTFGHSEGLVFLQGQPDQHRQEERDRWRAYECQLVEYLVRWTRLLRAALGTTRVLESVGITDPNHPLALASFVRLSRDFIRLWTRPLASSVKAELVLLLNVIAQSCSANEERETLAIMWGDFVRGCVMQNVQMLQQVCACVYVCMYVCMYVRMCGCACVCVCVCVCLCV